MSALRQLLVALAVALTSASACDAENSVVWKSIGPGLEAAQAQKWNVERLPEGARARSFEFSALRFHLGYYEIKIVNIADFSRSKAGQIARDQNVAADLPALFELGARAVFQTNPFNAPIVAVAPGNFATSSQEPTARGLLKINGIEKSKLLEKGPSAILCLDNAPSADFQYQVPTYYRTNNMKQRRLVAKCHDELQVGPRIIEDPKNTERQEFDVDPEKYRIETYSRIVKGNPEKTPVFLGIPPKQANATPYNRAVLAVDEPGRFGEKLRDREVARNGYLIVTANPATLWDLQDMLASPAFYANEAYAPHWAVNLPGDNYACMIYVSSLSVQQRASAPAIEVGPVDQRQASVLVVTQRK